MDLYLIALIAGGGLLLLSFLLDDFLDFDLGFPIFGTVGVLAGSFGAAGLIARGILPDQSLIYLLVSSAVALVVTTAFILFWRGVKRMAHDGPQENPQALIGRFATVNWWAGRSGEVLAVYQGTRRKLHAQLPAEAADAPITSGAQLYVLDVTVREGSLAALIVAPPALGDGTSGA